MIPLTFLYVEYIDRPKLTEQKKTHLSIYFLPPQVGSEQQAYKLTGGVKNTYEGLFRLNMHPQTEGHKRRRAKYLQIITVSFLPPA